MGKKKRKLKKKNHEATNEDFGTCVLYCKACDYEFEEDWETIFAIQEGTHGYVGFHLNDVFMTCPKCDQMVSDKSEDDALLPHTKNANQKQSIRSTDDKIPF